MSRIRGRDTKPELALRSMLHRLGYRFTVHGPNNKSLPGKPDLVLPKYRTVIFVHGCFWHGHENSLRCQGWHVLTIWECALKTASAREWPENGYPHSAPLNKAVHMQQSP